MMEVDREQRLSNQHRLRALKNDDSAKVTIFFSHDAIKLERMQQLAGTPRVAAIVPARSRNVSGAPVPA